jgi:hypothetical protein
MDSLLFIVFFLPFSASTGLIMFPFHPIRGRPVPVFLFSFISPLQDEGDFLLGRPAVHVLAPVEMIGDFRRCAYRPAQQKKNEYQILNLP